MIRIFGRQVFGGVNSSHVLDEIYDDAETVSHHYVVQGNSVEFNNPRSGTIEGVVLEANSVSPFACVMEHAKRPNGWLNSTSHFLLPQRFLDFLSSQGAGKINDLKRNLLVFYRGEKLRSGTPVIESDLECEIEINAGQAFLHIPSLSNLDLQSESKRYLEVMVLCPTIFDASSYMRQRVEAGNEIMLNSSLNTYQTKDLFYQNVIVFKNGKFCCPRKDYFVMDDMKTLGFREPFTNPEFIEFYFLKKTNKVNNFYFSLDPLEDELEIQFPEYPNTRLKRI